MFSTLAFKQKESTLTKEIQVPLLSSKCVEEYKTAETAWLPKQQKTLMVPEKALTTENESILQLRAGIAGDESLFVL